MLALRHIAALAIAVSVGGAALAQSAPTPTTVSEPPPSQVLTIDTPLEALVAVPTAKAVLDADVPGLTDHPMYGRFKHESLRALAPKFGGAISDKVLAKIQTDLGALTLVTASR